MPLAACVYAPSKARACCASTSEPVRIWRGAQPGTSSHHTGAALVRDETVDRPRAITQPAVHPMGHVQAGRPGDSSALGSRGAATR